MRTIEAVRLGFPDPDGGAVVGEGRDVETGETVRFVVPPEQRLAVLAAAHRGERPIICLHSIDVLPWHDVLGLEWEEH
jgi:hypothetical protein